MMRPGNASESRSRVIIAKWDGVLDIVTLLPLGVPYIKSVFQETSGNEFFKRDNTRGVCPGPK